eukprot:TRINITY_DN1761_c0_g1_i3.p1 TRINITY_DN1761_c0_g1~~TRINITY_DN1761_c0_g1_i3.p1  ORF type:complete len:238 (+),score=52.10 TRINITY_DN1761_c0_g1_i3:211-924(+)
MEDLNNISQISSESITTSPSKEQFSFLNIPNYDFLKYKGVPQEKENPRQSELIAQLENRLIEKELQINHLEQLLAGKQSVIESLKVSLMQAKGSSNTSNIQSQSQTHWNEDSFMYLQDQLSESHKREAKTQEAFYTMKQAYDQLFKQVEFLEMRHQSTQYGEGERAQLLTQLKESHTQISSLIQQQEISNNSIERLKMDLKLEKEKLHELAVATKQLLGNSHNVYSIFTELKETIVK